MVSNPPSPPAPGGVYVHFPFCSIRCTYCDFATVAGQDARIEAYLDALVGEIRRFQAEAPRDIDTVYFGGGTPSRMTPPQVRRVLGAVRGAFDMSPRCEVTLEANPESVSPELAAGWLDAGVTRLSLGVQSLDDAVLAAVGRAHDAAKAADAFRVLRDAGFQTIGVDAIAGLPGERLRGWPETVTRLVEWAPDHVSVYLLESDKDTPLGRAVRSGRTRVASDDRLGDAYAETVRVLEACGYRQYEISNFCRPGRESRHNLKYWTDAPYAAFGLGAHAYFAGTRRANVRSLEAYLSAGHDGMDPVDHVERWDPRRRLEEALMLGLRLNEGVDLRRLGGRYGTDVRSVYGPVWDRHARAGLLRAEGGTVRLTRRGRLLSNEVFADLLGFA